MAPSTHDLKVLYVGYNPSTAELSTFTGGEARLWRFTATHDLLMFELRASGRTAYLVLTGCSHMTMPVVWSIASPELHFDAKDSNAPVTFVDGAIVRVRCEGAITEEEPLRR